MARITYLVILHFARHQRQFFTKKKQILNDIISNSSTSTKQEAQEILSGTSIQPTSYSQNHSEVKSQSENTYYENLPDISTLQPHLVSTVQPSSHLSSVFSSFTNILNIGGSNNNNNNNKKEIVHPPPNDVIESIIGQNNSNPEPVPLFSADTPEFNQQKPPTATGPVNVFRRSGAKRPAYAQIPGLSNALQQPQTFPSQNIPPLNLLPTIASQPQLAPQSFVVPSAPSPSNSISSTSSIEPVVQNLPNQFKPISPPPPYSQSLPLISQPLATVPAQSGIFAQLGSTETSYKDTISPVMDAISADELSRSSTFSGAHVISTQAVPNYSNNNEGAPITHVYRPVYHHWFFLKEIEGKKIWQPFSMLDSLALEQAFTSNDLDPEKVIATDGGRYDVNILRRQRNPVYWKANPTEVRRCSWFHKNSSDSRLIPYEENIATKLEEEYKIAFESNQWHRTIELSQEENIVFHGPEVLVLFSSKQVPDGWGNTTNQSRARVVKRGMDEFDIDEGEPAEVDHILFLLHGIGSVCDLKFRSVEEVVDEFRSIAFQLVQSHYKSSCEQGKVSRIEVLPISWHSKLHSEETGIDDKLRKITLESIPRLRTFANETILDIFCYASPFYCQNIINTVGTELNRIYDLFRQRNPSFQGNVSVGGHSLGSLILFDLLTHQHNKTESECEESDEIYSSSPELRKPEPDRRRMSKRISYLMGNMGIGQPQINYPLLKFEPRNFFALGSPIGLFVIVRGLDVLGEEFSLPTCPGFFNIFHPYDPVAYRIESLISPELGKLKPVLIPHHKGRKRMHLELKETMARVGADLKQKVIDSMRNTWNSVYQLAMFHKQPTPNLEEEVSKAFRDQIGENEELETDPYPDCTNIHAGKLNNGKRIDYVLQEAPFEFFNDYIFAVTSHVCYWESEDTVLLMLKEIYTSMGITSDSQIPQQTMTIERPYSSSPRHSTSSLSFQQSTEMRRTKPLQMSTPIQPPPVTGFVRKT